MTSSRRTFLEILTKGTVSTALLPYAVSGCDSPRPSAEPVRGIAPSSADAQTLAEGLDYELLIRWDDPISEQDTFGFNNDFIAFLPDAQTADTGTLWVNHEYVHPLFIHQQAVTDKTRQQIEREMYAVGGSLVRVKKKNGW